LDQSGSILPQYSKGHNTQVWEKPCQIRQISGEYRKNTIPPGRKAHHAEKAKADQRQSRFFSRFFVARKRFLCNNNKSPMAAQQKPLFLKQERK